MNRLKLGGVLEAPEIALGCRRLWQAAEKQAQQVVETALEQGVNFYDLADVYGDGKSEELFARASAATVALSFADFERFLVARGNRVVVLPFPV
jgi:predicted oxidoreductase